MDKKPIALKYTLLLAIGIALIIGLLIATKPEPDQQRRELPPMQVSVTQARLADIQPQVVVGGLLQPAQQARLQFQVEGRVEQRLVEPGQRVNKGDELLRLEAGDYLDSKNEAAARLQQEQAAVERDKRLLALAERNVELQQQEVARQKRLGTDSLSSRAALDAAQQRLIQLEGEREQLLYAVNSSDARLAIQQANVQRATRNWQRTRLSAPFAGVVNQVRVKAGDNIAAKDLVVELIDLNTLEFYAEIEAANAGQLQLGQTIELMINGQAHEAQIIALQQSPDPETYSYALRAGLTNPGVLPGTAAEARLRLPIQEQVVVVPVAAIVHDDGQSHVFVINDHSLHKRPVSLGLRQGDQQVILSGLAADERLVASGGAGLSDGLKVSY